MTRPKSKKVFTIRTQFEQHKKELFDTNGKVNPPSHPVWKVIAKEIDYTVSSKYLYTIIACNRHGLRDDLQPPSTGHFSGSRTEVIVQPSSPSNPSINSSDVDSDSDSLQFTITLSVDEWLSIRPECRTYKDGRVYSVLKPGRWTDIIASHFWDHTRLPCALIFKRANMSENVCFLKITGFCKSCDSKFYGELTKEPCDNKRVLICCKYSGKFSHCECDSKRQLKGHRRKEVSKMLLSTRLAPSAYRKQMANVFMEHGDIEPSILPSNNVLKNAKYEKNKRSHLNEDVLKAINLLKYNHPYYNYIKDIGMDRFFVHYWSTPQIHVYNRYCKSAQYSIIAIDATGGVVRKIQRPNEEKSGAILLYDIAVRDTCSGMQYSVSNMLSERNDSDSITHWLSFWKRDGASAPNEIVCDMSIALLSAAVRTFTEFPSLAKYLDFCYNFLILKQYDDFFNLNCYVRCDVAHVIKVFCGWPCLKTALRRSRQFYKRCLGQLIQAKTIEEAQRIVEAIFVVALNESGGNYEGCVTPCEKRKEFLRNLIGDEYGEDVEEVPEENVELHSFDNNNFVEWGRSIQHSVEKRFIIAGTQDNCQYLPAIVPHIINFLKLLPLWSHVMSPVFINSSKTASSASVESNFNDLKNRIFSNNVLPLRVDEFLSQHIQSLEGTMKLAASGYNRHQADHNNPDNNVPAINDREKFEAPKINSLEEEANKDILKGTSPPTDDFDEFNEEENWGGTVIKKRKRSSYLQVNSEWLKIDLNQKANVVPIGILKNGNNSSLKPVVINKQRYILRNTCGFDALIHLLCTNYCDSEDLCRTLERKENSISKIVKQVIKQINIKAYNLRVLLLLKIFDENNLSILPNQTLQLSTECTMESLIRRLCFLGELEYSYIETIQCPQCTHLRLIPTAVLSVSCKKYSDLENELQKYCIHHSRSKVCLKENCNTNTNSKMDFNENYIFLEVIDKSPEHPQILPTKICDIPVEITINDSKYKLGGIIAYSGSQLEDPNIVGHFKTYSCRINNRWEMYDDLKNKKIDCSNQEELFPHLVFFRK